MSRMLMADGDACEESSSGGRHGSRTLRWPLATRSGSGPYAGWAAAHEPAIKQKTHPCTSTITGAARAMQLQAKDTPTRAATYREDSIFPSSALLFTIFNYILEGRLQLWLDHACTSHV